MESRVVDGPLFQQYPEETLCIFKLGLYPEVGQGRFAMEEEGWSQGAQDRCDLQV